MQPPSIKMNFSRQETVQAGADLEFVQRVDRGGGDLEVCSKYMYVNLTWNLRSLSCLLIKHTKQTIFYRTSSDSPKSSDLFSNADKIIDYLKFKNQLKVMRGFVLLLKILADAGRV